MEIRFVYITLFFSFLLNEPALSAEDFCNNINNYAKNKDVTTKYIDEIKKFFFTYYVK